MSTVKLELIIKCVVGIDVERIFTDALNLILPLTFQDREHHASFKMHLGRASI